MPILDTLRSNHPRLITLGPDLDRIKDSIAEYPEARAIRDRLLKNAEDILGEPPVKHELIGPRLLGQSRLCLERVYTLALLYRLEGDERFAERAKKEIFAAAAFPNWNPSHFLDTAEMTHALAIGYDWLYDYLDEESRATVRDAIIDKGMKPALREYEERIRWTVYEFNWSQVCNGGISIGALAVADEEPAMAERVLSRALVAIRAPMATYAPDGGWDEGPGYWHYATRYNAYMLAAVESALGSDFDLLQLPGFAVTGDFRVQFVGPTGRTFNYADADEMSTGAHEMFWLARKFDNPLYAWHQHGYLDDPSPFDLMWFEPRGHGPVEVGFPLDAHFQKTGVTFMRSAWEDPDAVFVGFKGGDNRVSHSQLDLGSFVLDALGNRWATDLGKDDYNLHEYFGARRWDYYRMRTESHNTLLINNENQPSEAKASISKFVSRPDRSFTIANLSDGYPMMSSVRRGVALVDRTHLLVQDEVESSEPADVLWGVLTPADVEVDGASAVLTQGETHVVARILEPDGAVFETLDASPEPPQMQNPDITRLVVRLPSDVKSERIAVVFTPYRSGETVGEFSEAIKPLSAWE
jgi:hypothetical protein